MPETQMAILPAADYKNACDAVRRKTGKTGLIPSGDLSGEIKSIPHIRTYADGQAESEAVACSVDKITIKTSYLLDPGVEYTCVENTGGTELTGTIEASSGDWILCTVTTRSTTTLPSGWTLLHSSDALSTDNYIQRMSILCCQATEDGTVSFTVKQAASAIIYINQIKFSGISGFAYHEGTEILSDEKADTYTANRPDCDSLVWCCSAVTWSNGMYPWMKCHEIDTFPISLAGKSAQRRQTNFVDRGTGETRTFLLPFETAAIIDCVEILT